MQQHLNFQLVVKTTILLHKLKKQIEDQFEQN